MPYFKYDGSAAAETVQPTTNNFGTSAVETLTGGSGADGLYGSDRDTLIGGAGDDTYYFQGNNISVVEAASAGVDKIVAWQNVNLAKTPNVENLEVGGNGAPGVYGAGNQLDNLIVANGSLQQLYGGAGQDVLVGSASGADTFIVIKGEGNDALYNFDPAKDVLRLSAGYTSFGQVQSHMTQVGGDLKIADTTMTGNTGGRWTQAQTGSTTNAGTAVGTNCHSLTITNSTLQGVNGVP